MVLEELLWRLRQARLPSPPPPPLPQPATSPSSVESFFFHSLATNLSTKMLLTSDIKACVVRFFASESKKNSFPWIKPTLVAHAISPIPSTVDYDTFIKNEHAYTQLTFRPHVAQMRSRYPHQVGAPKHF